jgi:hypothetical protein
VLGRADGTRRPDEVTHQLLAALRDL